MDNIDLTNKTEIWTDGACKGNPGKGGWGVVIKRGLLTEKLSGYQAIATNNQMELKAAIEALKYLSTNANIVIVSDEVHLTTDSIYVRDGITKWIKGWVKNGWKTQQRKPVKNVVLWKELDLLNKKYRVQWHWVKAHNGHPENTIADKLASDAATTQT